MEAVIMGGQLLLGLGLLVFIHELGHYLAARAFGIRVEKFYIFFDFGGWKLFSKRVKNTEYGIGWFPLGGYVKISGMIDESMDKSYQNTPPQPWEFRSKPAWQRFIVMVAGITMNLLLGIFIFAFWLLQYQKEYIPPENIKDGIYAYRLARELGLQTGDKIISINGKPVKRSVDFVSLKVFFGANIEVERGGKIVTVNLPDDLFQHFKTAKTLFISPENFPFVIDSVTTASARKAGLMKGDRIIAFNGEPVRVWGEMREKTFDHIGKTATLLVLRNSDTLMLEATVTQDSLIGIKISEDPYPHKKYSLASAFYFGTKDGFEAIWFNAAGLMKIISGKVKASESVQSPIGIAMIYGPVWRWEKFWYLTGLISFILAFMNILPIPALDGGHVMFILFEVIRGKPVSDKFLERAQVVGMVVLLALMTFAFGNDLYKIFFK
ncbi:MAG TPA: RIP metalloprotease RseP [Chitinophagales bacterium]|nr:RIP metalloprotease RseP [Chitinophagales bacterium]